ncbi:MAG: hypothetical protein M1830_008751 [Pleopsidium flavum]|nr:MAG: hypothetical protein M1830_008751 [Pleopsidium flavum]
MGDFITEAFTLLAVAIVIIGLRTYARATSAGIRNFEIDDYFMLVAAVVYSLETAAAYSVGAKFHGLANNSMTDEERTTLVPNSPEWNMRVGGSKIQIIGWSLYTLLLWILKLCMNVFYGRLTEGLDGMQTRIKIGLVAIGVTYVTTILSILLGCRPLHKNWQINPDPGNYCQPAVSKIDLYVTVVLNVVTDLYLISIPLPLLWKARIPARRKYLLLVMFSGGIFVMMAGILRCVLILTAGANGAQQAGSWACRETFVAIIIGNIPMIYPLFRRSMQRMGATWLFTHNGSTGRSGGGDGGGWSQQLSDRKADRKAKFSHPLSRSTLTGSDSVEHIVNPAETTITKDGINITTETAVITSNSSRRDEEAAYPHSHYEKPTLSQHQKPGGAGYSFHVSSKSQGDRGYQQQ